MLTLTMEWKYFWSNFTIFFDLQMRNKFPAGFCLQYFPKCNCNWYRKPIFHELRVFPTLSHEFPAKLFLSSVELFSYQSMNYNFKRGIQKVQSLYAWKSEMPKFWIRALE